MLRRRARRVRPNACHQPLWARVSSPPVANRILVVGWDGADWDILDPLLAAGTTGDDDRIVRALEASEARWRSTAVAAAGLGAFALLAALVALTVALLR